MSLFTLEVANFEEESLTKTEQLGLKGWVASTEFDSVEPGFVVAQSTCMQLA